MLARRDGGARLIAVLCGDRPKQWSRDTDDDSGTEARVEDDYKSHD
jgi:hypothetical protein